MTGGRWDHPVGDVEAAMDGLYNLPLAIVVTEGVDHRIVACSEGLRGMTGDRPLLGRPVRECFPELVGQRWLELYDETLETGDTTLAEEMRVQFTREDGSTSEIFIDTGYAPRIGPDGRVVGAIGYGRDVTDRVEARRRAEKEVHALRAQLAEARGAVRSVQRALLPTSVPVLPRLQLAGRYVVATDEAAAGGDWFDVVTTPDGRVVLLVGDVVGHGTPASGVMGLLRGGMRAALADGRGIVDALTQLDGLAATLPGARGTTLAVVDLHPSDGRFTYCTAGHPPPLVVGSDDEATRFLVPTGAGPLATGTTFAAVDEVLGEDECLLLYTDGIIERPATPPGRSTVELRQVASGAYRNDILPVGAPPVAVDRVCGLTIELLTRFTGYRDDITLVAASRRSGVSDLRVEVDALPGAAGTIRAALGGWLAETTAGAHVVDVLLHATTELVENVADHAYPVGESGPVVVEAGLLDDGTAVVTVADEGCWAADPPAPGRGRGLALVRHLVDRLEVERTPSGTVATMHHPLTRPAGVVDVGPLTDDARAVDGEDFDVYPEAGPEPVIHLRGAIDSATVHELRAHLLVALSDAADVLAVDLTEVTLLASSGIAALYEASEQAAAEGRRLVVRARAGTPAQQALALVGLPFDSDDGPA
jgi:anti-anti-sigma factor